jgi:SAM-dependent methyltransferase|tara:strand:- start:158 stop:709 length:552 start_codon:yes stop_codon:yes gene_type:complete
MFRYTMWSDTTQEDKDLFNENGYAITYGELTLDGLKDIMKKVDDKKDKVFVDLGSGNGNIVINAIKEYPQLYMSIGVELSKSRHDVAMDNYMKENVNIREKVKFLNQDILDDGFDYSDFDIIYISNLCFPDDVNIKLSKKIKKECNPSTHIFCSKQLHDIDKIESFPVCQTWTNNSIINYYKI